MTESTQTTRIKAFDWAVTVPIKGNRTSVDKSRRVLIYWLVNRGEYWSGRINALQGATSGRGGLRIG